MARATVVTLDLPANWQGFRLPPALQDRLNELLDRQDRDGKLTVKERREAKALVELVDMLSVLKAHSQARPGHGSLHPKEIGPPSTRSR